MNCSQLGLQSPDHWKYGHLSETRYQYQNYFLYTKTKTHSWLELSIHIEAFQKCTHFKGFIIKVICDLRETASLKLSGPFSFRPDVEVVNSTLVE